MAAKKAGKAAMVGAKDEAATQAIPGTMPQLERATWQMFTPHPDMHMWVKRPTASKNDDDDYQSAARKLSTGAMQDYKSGQKLKK